MSSISLPPPPETDRSAFERRVADIRALNRSPIQIPTLEIKEGEDLWVFGYGSLMWNPEFPFVERRYAVLHGYHRSFCVYSHRYRGTPERPGLVLGLDAGGACKGIAYRIAAEDEPSVLDYLWYREMVSGVYRPTLHPVDLAEPEEATTHAGRSQRVDCCCFVADRRHRQYAGGLPYEESLRLLRQGVGMNGPNRDYLLNTVDHLRQLGVEDQGLERFAAQIDHTGS